jgi:hypothetical protein
VSWADAYIARRNAAAAFLDAQREQSAHSQSLPYWRVPGYSGLFDDAQLMDMARSRGWSAQYRDRAAIPNPRAARGATPLAPGAGANCPSSRPGATSSMEALHG